MIVNTRPKEIGDKTNSLLVELQCNFIHLPLTEIKKIEPPTAAKILLDKLGNYDAVIFTSQSAVKFGIKFFQEKFEAVKYIPVISIGLATQSCLNELGIPSDVPQTFNSEGIANLIKKRTFRNCLVFCGDKPPQLISMTDAEIDIFPCYKSQDKKNVDFERIKKLSKSVILIYTHQSLEILVKNLTTYEMEKIILICASKRILKLALNYNFEDCILSESPLDKDVLDAAMKMLKLN